MVDSTEVSQLRNGIGTELFAVFRDDMLEVRRVPAEEYDGDADDDEVIVAEFRAPARVIADRLDAMGVDAAAVRDLLDEQFGEEKGHGEDFLSNFDGDIRVEIDRSDALLRSLDATAWIDRLRETQGGAAPASDRFRAGSRAWPLSQLDYWDERFALRLVLLAMPEAVEVILDVADLDESGWFDGEPIDVASRSMETMRAVAAMHAPTVILTEGRTDSEFLSSALRILFPHLTDLVRFLDFDQKPEGGAVALVRLIKAFAAAGIANRAVALLDNDAAAVDALRTLDQSSLPANIRVLRYPDTSLAAAYPTLGPPTAQAPHGSSASANVNGLAASIELYLERDVLTLPTGELRPVHWRSFLAS